jgi:hypothetical protein
LSASAVQPIFDAIIDEDPVDSTAADRWLTSPPWSPLQSDQVRQRPDRWVMSPLSPRDDLGRQRLATTNGQQTGKIDFAVTVDIPARPRLPGPWAASRLCMTPLCRRTA